MKYEKYGRSLADSVDDFTYPFVGKSVSAMLWRAIAKMRVKKVAKYANTAIQILDILRS